MNISGSDIESFLVSRTQQANEAGTNWRGLQCQEIFRTLGKKGPQTARATHE